MPTDDQPSVPDKKIEYVLIDPPVFAFDSNVSVDNRDHIVTDQKYLNAILKHELEREGGLVLQDNRARVYFNFPECPMMEAIQKAFRVRAALLDKWEDVWFAMSSMGIEANTAAFQSMQIGQIPENAGEVLRITRFLPLKEDHDYAADIAWMRSSAQKSTLRTGDSRDIPVAIFHHNTPADVEISMSDAAKEKGLR